ncbi:hypothetical protein FHR90_003120 [Endobacter medicaginis]|uniref:Uncharacterized protein n=1 Tax=Endobacter medicaginis TaxID=1181271 RepID=A0A839UZQ5_9PROT|nr:hypothetical protein [Endobacter medicaginis]MBB3175266.1 hypothetical protein [Endobacter medicaginis]MCX5476606.1 hypothetical protein [Endobacter medicaginis]
MSAAQQSSAAEWFEPGLLARRLGHGVSEELVAEMLGHARLRLGLDRLLSRRAGPAEACTLLALDRIGLLAFLRRLGAVWNAPDLTRAIDGTAVRELVAAVGPSLRQAAIRHAALLPAHHPRRGLSVAELVRQIPIDGLACLTAWADTRPDAIRTRIELRVGRADVIDFAQRTHAPGLVEALAEMASAPEAA